jgi:DNA-binding beta-propeller fold protein YncE
MSSGRARLAAALCVLGLAIAALAALAPRAEAAGGDQQWVARYDGPGHGDDGGASVAISPDGKRAYVTGTSAGTLATGQDYATIAYDVATGAQLWVARYDFRIPGSAADRAGVLALSRDGSTVYVSGESGNEPKITTIAYNAATGAQVWVARSNFPDRPRGIAVSGDGTRVFVLGSVGRHNYDTLAYDAATGAQLWTARYDGAANRDDYPSAIGVSPDGTRVYVTGTSQESSRPKVVAATTVAYAAATGAQVWVDHFTDDGTSGGYSLAVSPDGERVYVTGGSGFKHFTTIAYNAASGTRAWSTIDTAVAGTGGLITTSPDGKRVYAAGPIAGMAANTGDFGTLAYDAATGARLWTSRYAGAGIGSNGVSGLAVNPNGAQVYVTGTNVGSGSAQDYATVAYRATDGSQAWAARYNGPANLSDYAGGMDVSPDGSRLILTGSVDQVRSDFATIAYDTGTKVATGPAPLAVPLDVRPDQCPNRLKIGSAEDLSVAIAGAPGLDVRQIDPASLRLKGLAPRSSSLTDVTTPYRPYTGRTRPSQCINPGPDGTRDLSFKFAGSSLAKALGPHAAGDVVVLHVTGKLKDGTRIAGEDVVTMTR